MLSTSQKIAADISALLRARNPLIWIVTREESRVERYLFEAAASAGYVPRTWDVAQGAANMAGRPENICGRDPGEILEAIQARTGERGIWILRDFHAWVSGPGAATTLRQLRNLARSLPGAARDSAQAVIVVSPSGDIPPELGGHATVIDWPMPDRAEIAAILDAAIASLPDDIRTGAAPNGTREAAIDSAVGLNGEEAAACFAKSLVQLRRIDPGAVAKEKKRVVARERILEWFDPLPGGLESVGGLDMLKAWLVSRRGAYTKEARAYGLPAPRGCLLVGVPGCGKSLTAKAVATAWQIPLLRLDLGALKSKFVGESESNLRKAFAVIESVGRCVVWIDEIEKALQGATSGASDGGVSSDALGAILNWMQERSGESFVIATANDVSALPPELLRKGRFDELFFVDLPNVEERAAIARATLRQHGREGADIDLSAVAAACDGYTGAEISALVPDALFAAFADGAREIETADILTAAESIVPLSVTMAEKIAALRNWAKTRARPATTPTAAADRASGGRQIDLA